MTSLAGSFLIAKPVLQDPNFEQTVVLLLRHNEEGAFGLVINRPGKAKELPFPIYVGGPCNAAGLILLHGHGDWAITADELNEEIAPGIWIGDADTLRRVTDLDNSAAARYRVFAGYSGWGPDQLERELASGAWIRAEGSAEFLFDTPLDDIWDKLSPPSIPRPSLN